MSSVVRSLVKSTAKMKIVQFKCDGEKVRLGVLKGEKVLDLKDADKALPDTLVELLQRGDALETLNR